MMGDRACWHADTGVALVEATVGEVLTTVATRTPHVDALRWVEGGCRYALSYNELLERATGRARQLVSLASPGDRVAVWAPNSVDWVVLEYGSALAGTVLVPLNPALLDRELEQALSSSRAVALFTVVESRGKPLLDRGRAVAAGSSDLRTIVDLHAPVAAEDGPSLPQVRPGDPFIVQYTSGTTGQPKGAVLSHRAAYNSARMYGLLLDVGVTHQVSCAPLPFHHVAGSVSRALGSLAVGGTLVVLPDADVEKLADATVKCGVTHGGLIGKLAMEILDDRSLLAKFDGHCLRTVGMGGAGIASDLIRRVEAALGVRVVNGYGQSESPHITLTLAEDTDEDRWHSIGRPVPQRDVAILRPDGTVAELGEAGEICTRGPLVMTGYLDAPEATKAALADGWLHTGDYGSMDARGVLRFVGRVRDVIIRGGENVYPAEIEDRLIEHSEITEAAVVAVPDPRWGEQILAYVRLTSGSSLRDEDLRTYARTVLAPFKVPAYWVRVDSFPRTAIGKIKKADLAANAADLVSSGLPSSSPPQPGGRPNDAVSIPEGTVQ